MYLRFAVRAEMELPVMSAEQRCNHDVAQSLLFDAKCTEHNGDSPMCQADASCREAEIVRSTEAPGVCDRSGGGTNPRYILMANRNQN